MVQSNSWIVVTIIGLISFIGLFCICMSIWFETDISEQIYAVAKTDTNTTPTMYTENDLDIVDDTEDIPDDDLIIDSNLLDSDNFIL